MKLKGLKKFQLIHIAKKSVKIRFADYCLFARKFVTNTIILIFFAEICSLALAEFLIRAVFQQNISELGVDTDTVLSLLQSIAWLIMAILFPIYWLRTNTKMFGFRATKNYISDIKIQKQSSDTIFCPRCGHEMTVNAFTEKINTHVDDKVTYENEIVYDTSGRYVRTIRRKRVQPIYEKIDYQTSYSVCQNKLCEFQNFRPGVNELIQHRFWQMPYKLLDVVSYLNYNRNTSKRSSGCTTAYKMGLPSGLLLFISAIILWFSYARSFTSITYLLDPSFLIRCLFGTCIIIGALLILSIMAQLICHKQKGSINISDLFVANKKEPVIIQTDWDIQRKLDAIREAREREQKDKKD